MLENLLTNVIQTPDGTAIESTSTHQTVVHKDSNGLKYSVDGGLSYNLRTVHKSAPYTELSLTTDNDHLEIRNEYKLRNMMARLGHQYTLATAPTSLIQKCLSPPELHSTGVFSNSSKSGSVYINAMMVEPAAGVLSRKELDLFAAELEYREQCRKTPDSESVTTNVLKRIITNIKNLLRSHNYKTLDRILTCPNFNSLSDAEVISIIRTSSVSRSVLPHWADLIFKLKNRHLTQMMMIKSYHESVKATNSLLTGLTEFIPDYYRMNTDEVETPTLRLIRGLPGSGKSTLADSLPGLKVEADSFFYKNGVYEWDGALLEDAHKKCFADVKRFILAGHDVNVANTFVTAKEVEKYFVFASNYAVEFEIVVARLGTGSVHNVPAETMDRMAKKWQSTDSILRKLNKK